MLDAGASTTLGQIFGFSIGTRGVIDASAPVSTTIPSTGSGRISNIAIDPTGKLMAVPNNFDGPPGTISPYTISGAVLTATTPATGSAENAPSWVSFYNAHHS